VLVRHPVHLFLQRATPHMTSTPERRWESVVWALLLVPQDLCSVGLLPTFVVRFCALLALLLISRAHSPLSRATRCCVLGLALRGIFFPKPPRVLESTTYSPPARLGPQFLIPFLVVVAPTPFIPLFPNLKKLDRCSQVPLNPLRRIRSKLPSLSLRLSSIHCHPKIFAVLKAARRPHPFTIGRSCFRASPASLLRHGTC